MYEGKRDKCECTLVLGFYKSTEYYRHTWGRYLDPKPKPLNSQEAKADTEAKELFIKPKLK